MSYILNILTITDIWCLIASNYLSIGDIMSLDVALLSSETNRNCRFSNGVVKSVFSNMAYFNDVSVNVYNSKMFQWIVDRKIRSENIILEKPSSLFFSMLNRYVYRSHIKSINLENSHFSSLSGYVTDNGLILIGQNCSSLTELNLNNRKTYSHEGLAFVFYKCKNLQTLKIDKCRCISSLSYFPLQLNCLSIRHCYISDFQLSFIAKQCPNLRSIDISDNALITGSGLKQLLHYCSELKYVSLNNHSNLIDVDLMVFIDESQQEVIQTLDLKGCSVENRISDMLLAKLRRFIPCLIL